MRQDRLASLPTAQESSAACLRLESAGPRRRGGGGGAGARGRGPWAPRVGAQVRHRPSSEGSALLQLLGSRGSFFLLDSLVQGSKTRRPRRVAGCFGDTWEAPGGGGALVTRGAAGPLAPVRLRGGLALRSERVTHPPFPHCLKPPALRNTHPPSTPCNPLHSSSPKLGLA